MDPLTAAIVGSVISTAAQGLLTPAPEEPAMGLVRTLPDGSKIGVMQPVLQGQVKIDGKTYPLSPGAQIRNESNLIVFPTMVQSAVRVRFQLDYTGAVHRVWILSSAEVRLPENR
jgi:hypothetical protein